MANVSSSNSLGERVPKLRFPEFEGEWDFELFSDLFTFLSNNTLSRAELSETGNIRNIHYGDILVRYTDVINIDDEIMPFVSNNSEGKVRCDVLRTGDVIITDTAEDDTVGKAIEIINHNNKSVVSGLHTMPCRPNRDFTASFLGYYINSNTYHSQLYPYMQGIKVTSISKANIGKTLIHFPSRSEQKKIVELFNLIEKKILVQKKLVKALKLYKRGLLSKLFPQKGESVPHYRFTGFMDAWEQRKFGEITELKSASRVHKEEWTTEGVPFYRSSDVMAAINGTENDKAFISQELYEKLSSASGRLEAGDILVTGGGSVGNPYIVPDNAPLYTKDADLLWIKNQGRFNSYFVYEFFLSPSFRSYLGSISHVGTIAHYTITQLSETPISLPSVEEQDKLGKYFQRIDHLITLHQRKYNSYKKEKLALLQQMFI